LFKHRVTRVTALGLVVGLSLGATALADGPPSRKPVPAAKKAPPAVKKPGTAKKASVAVDPGKALVDRACQACHDLGTVTQARHTAKQWPGVVVRMRANGADLTDSELKQVQDYLVRTYAVTP
jgi:mono/diheme cytochrome c family protein